MKKKKRRKTKKKEMGSWNEKKDKEIRNERGQLQTKIKIRR